MAYMSQERKAQLAPAIKAVFKKYGLKGSIAVRNHMTLCVTIKEGPIDFIGNMLAVAETRPDSAGRDNGVPTSIQVNHFWIDEHYSGQARECLSELKDAMQGADWYDRSDIQTDYFDVSWYIDIDVGKWNRPYRLTNGK